MTHTPLVNACTWLMRLAWLHLCWIMMTLAGGILLGILPATVVVCLMLRRYLNGTTSIKAGAVYASYSTEFMRVNRTGWLLLLPILSGGWYVQQMLLYGAEAWAVVAIALVPILLIAFMTLFAVLIQMSIYQTTVKGNFQNGLAMVFGHSRIMLVSFIALIGTLSIGYLLPITLLFYGLTPVLLTAIALLYRVNDPLMN